MTYFVKIEFQADFLKTHTVTAFADAAEAVEFATSQTGTDVRSVKIYTNGAE
jgi:hypothetical protein